MKSDIQGTSTCPIGAEQYEEFKDSLHPSGAVQYDYRHTDGRLFSCVAPTLEKARDRCMAWAFSRGIVPIWVKMDFHTVPDDAS